MMVSVSGHALFWCINDTVARMTVLKYKLDHVTSLLKLSMTFHHTDGPDS